MFSRIAPDYDFLNHLLSFSRDRTWRRRAAQRFDPILRRADARILDLCCGTGDLAFALARLRSKAIRDRGARRFPIIGSDFSQPMVERAQEKTGGGGGTVFVAGDALSLPFMDASFDLITIAFGFRNLVDYQEGLREMARVLKQGGEVGILEFSEPARGWAAGFFRFYFSRILPRIGGAISGSREAYSYLPNSVARFPSPSELTALMKKTGFDEVSVSSWNFGSVNLHCARRV
jgi:demethylmenaquinone methyltransferase/2-methoxy-6-polyprenyl-1,4-benzoquinol methylase